MHCVKLQSLIQSRIRLERSCRDDSAKVAIRAHLEMRCATSVHINQNWQDVQILALSCCFSLICMMVSF